MGENGAPSGDGEAEAGSVGAARVLLAALVRAALLPDEEGGRWIAQAASHAADLRARPDALARLNLDGPWTLAVRDAESGALAQDERRASLTLPAACPLDLAALTAPDFDAAAAATRIRNSAGTG